MQSHHRHAHQSSSRPRRGVWRRLTERLWRVFDVYAVKDDGRKPWSHLQQRNGTRRPQS